MSFSTDSVGPQKKGLGRDRKSRNQRRCGLEQRSGKDRRGDKVINNPHEEDPKKYATRLFLSLYQHTVSVVIPTLNEKENLPYLLPFIPPWVHEVIMVDGYSSDGTKETARKLLPDIRILTQEGSGKGAALRTGFAAATGDIIVTFDADGSHDPAEISLFVGALLSGADFAKGSRFIQGGGTDDMEWYRRFGNWVLNLLVRLNFGGHYSDLCYGYNAFWARLLPKLKLDADGFEIETQINIRALQADLKIREVPSFEAERRHGESYLRTIPDGWRVLKTIIKEVLNRNDEGDLKRLTNTKDVQPRQSVDTYFLIDISVVICIYTEKRWDEFLLAVDSVKQQSIPPKEIIVVVDHNPSLLERVGAHVNGVVVVENGDSPGLSGSRNSGLEAAKGEVVAFLDDDAVAAPNWLEELNAGYRDPLVMGVGGQINPIWTNGRPKWIPEEFYWVVGCTYRGMPRESTHVRNFFGCNMSFRREVVEAIGSFRNNIGRKGTKPMGCEETELCIRAAQRWPKKVLLYKPSAFVYHRVPEKRACWSYFLLRCYSEGLSKALVSRCVGTKDGLASERAYTFKTLPQGGMRGLRDAVIHRDSMGLKRTGSIMVGLMSTTFGFLSGTVSESFKRLEPLPIKKVEISAD